MRRRKSQKKSFLHYIGLRRVRKKQKSTIRVAFTEQEAKRSPAIVAIIRRTTNRKMARQRRKDARMKALELFRRARTQARHDFHENQQRTRQERLEKHCEDIHLAYRRQLRSNAMKYAQKLYQEWDNAEAKTANQCQQLGSMEWQIFNLMNRTAILSFEMDLNGLDMSALNELDSNRDQLLEILREAEEDLEEPCSRLANSMEQGITVLHNACRVYKDSIGEKQRVENDMDNIIRKEKLDKSSQKYAQICIDKEGELKEIEKKESEEENEINEIIERERKILRREQNAVRDAQERKSRIADEQRLIRLQEILELKGIYRRHIMVRSLIRTRY